MKRPSSVQPSFEACCRTTVADKAHPHPRPRWTRGLPGITRRLTRSDSASLTWRIIVGGTRPGEPHGLLRAWLGWERVARSLWPVCEIPDAPYGLLRLRITAYWGEKVILPDATSVAPGAMIGELHCNNRAILDIVQQRSNPFAACREDLNRLSDRVQQDPLAHQIGRGVLCVYHPDPSGQPPRLHGAAEARYDAPAI